MSKYYVWRRNDGYVGCTCYEPRGWKNLSGEETTFDVLGVFNQWDQECIDFWSSHRSKNEYIVSPDSSLPMCQARSEEPI